MCITLPKAPVLKNYSLILFCDYLTFWESGAIDTPSKIYSKLSAEEFICTTTSLTCMINFIIYFVLFTCLLNNDDDAN